ncbi:MAG TPA: TadE/TadG family type IV pilus assembly protein [Candidatus Dormibacteraeota bacterium]
MSVQRRAARTRRTRGQSLVEFALIAPILIVLIVGAAQVAAILYAGITVASTAHDAAKVATEQPVNSTAFGTGGTADTGLCTPGAGCSSSVSCATAPSNVVCQAVAQSKGLLGTVDTTVYPGTAGTACATVGSSSWVGDGYVTVKVSNNVPIFVPFLNNLLATSGQTYRTISTSVVMRVEPCTMMSAAAH